MNSQGAEVVLKGLKSNLEGEFSVVLGLSPDDEDHEKTHHEDDAEGYQVPRSKISITCQNTECQHQHSFKMKEMLLSYV